MKKWRLLLLFLPLIAGAFYLRSLASWRPQKALIGQGQVMRLAFSRDGKTLLVGQETKPGKSYQLSALGATRDSAIRWTREYDFGYKQSDGQGDLRHLQFFASDTRFSLATVYPQTFDAQTGQMLWEYEGWGSAVVSPNGQWIAHDNVDPRVGRNVLVFLASGTETNPGHKANITYIIPGGPDLSALSYAFSPDSSTLAVGVTETSPKHKGTHLDFYDVKTRKRLRVCPDFKMPKTIELGAVAGVVQWSRDGRFLLVSWVVYNSNGDSYVALKSRPPVLAVSLWRVADSKRLASIWLQSRGVTEDFPFSIDHFEVQNDGRVLAVSTDGRVFLNTVATLSLKSKPLLTLPKETITTATMSPDCSYLVAGTQSGRVFWQRVK